MQPERELRSLGGGAFHLQIATHHQRELAADGKAEAGSTSGARVAVFHLNEWLKDPHKVVGRDADASIAHRKPDPFLARRLATRARPAFDVDATLFRGEL